MVLNDVFERMKRGLSFARSERRADRPALTVIEMSEKPSSPSVVHTNVDRLVEYVYLKQRVSSGEAGKALGLPVEQVEEWAKTLEDHGIFELNYDLFQGMMLNANPLGGEELVKKLEEIEQRRTVLSKQASELSKAGSELADKARDLHSNFSRIDSELDFAILHANKSAVKLLVLEKEKKNVDRIVLEVMRGSIEEPALFVPSAANGFLERLSGLFEKRSREVVDLENQARELEKSGRINKREALVLKKAIVNVKKKADIVVKKKLALQKIVSKKKPKKR